MMTGKKMRMDTGYAFDEIADQFDDWKVLHALGLWLLSAEWRGLIESRDPTEDGPMTYVLGPRAAVVLGHAAA